MKVMDRIRLVGIDKVKAIANYVTDTNDNDGVAKAIEKFVLNK